VFSLDGNFLYIENDEIEKYLRECLDLAMVEIDDDLIELCVDIFFDYLIDKGVVVEEEDCDEQDDSEIDDNGIISF
jgi:hypothetical protein